MCLRSWYIVRIDCGILLTQGCASVSGLVKPFSEKDKSMKRLLQSEIDASDISCCIALSWALAVPKM